MLSTILVLIHCLVGQASDNLADSNRVNCGHNYQSNCLIEATLGIAATADAIDVLVNCSNLDNGNTARSNQLLSSSSIERVVWNGCYAVPNLRFLGLRRLSSRGHVRDLTVERFTLDTIEDGTFDGFIQLEMLALDGNSIGYLLSTCFTGLENLLTLKMTENNLKRLDPETFTLPKLNVLDIVDRSLLITNHQFSWTVENVAMDINAIGIGTIENIFNHVRNLSISSSANIDYGVIVTVLNGYEHNWMIEDLSIDNVLHGIVSIEEIESIERIVITKGHLERVTIKDLENLRNLSIMSSQLREFPEFIGTYSHLDAIDLSYNKLTTVNMSILNRMESLKEIFLVHNDINMLTSYPSTLSSIHIHVNYNSLDCEWLSLVSTQDIFSTFVYDKNFTFINVNGLLCSLRHSQIQPLPFVSTDEDEHNFNVDVRKMAFVICCFIFLGIVIWHSIIYVYNKIRRRQPFYHMLRDSFVKPHAARETIASEFKGIVFRNLPPTNYEHPISSTKADNEVMMDVDENEYEEIPQKDVKLYEETSN